MNKGLLFSALLLTACSANKKADVDFGTVDDYQDFLVERAEKDAPIPFNAEPLQISAIGKVRAQPDIAVITAMIQAKNKNESEAMNETSKIINAIQDRLSDKQAETGFTGVISNRDFDETCLNANQLSRQRHEEINSDFYFNRRLDQRGDTETKRREGKTRLPQKVCPAQSITISTQMVIRIQPAEAAGDVLRAMAEAGAKETRLFGYDFSDYDALYQQAAEKAVTLAHRKAKMIARQSGGTLGEIESFSVSRPERQGRFGPQPHVIRPANRYRGPSGSVVDRQTNKRPNIVRRTQIAPQAHFSCWDGTVVFNATQCPAQAAQAAPQPFRVSSEVVPESGRRSIPAGQLMALPRVDNITTTNALSMSLLSGPQTISVTATMTYDYETPLDDKVILDRSGS